MKAQFLIHNDAIAANVSAVIKQNFGVSDMGENTESGLVSIPLQREWDVAETGVFAISINDGYCEHTYTIKLKDELSIHKLMKKICKKLKVDMPDSKLRWVR